MVSRELSLQKLVTTYLACVLIFGALVAVLVKIGASEMRFAIMGGVIYAVAITVCFLIFAVNWDVAVPNFQAWKAARH
jgi:hypothetical protein